MFDCEYGSRVPVILKFLPEKFGSTVTVALFVPLVSIKLTVAEINTPCTFMFDINIALVILLGLDIGGATAMVIPPNPLGPRLPGSWGMTLDRQPVRHSRLEVRI